MGESIAHPDPAERRVILRRFLAALDDRLSTDALAGIHTGPVWGGFAELVRSIDAGRDWPGRDVAPERLAVCRFWDRALEAGARGEVEPLVSALSALAPSLSWTQNPNYRRHPPTPAFLDNYGYAVIAGPADGAPALVVDSRLALGVLLLGPGTQYPPHRHPAIELYYTLTPDGEWSIEASPWRRVPPGTWIHHMPNVAHATRAGSGPLLALYLWHGDLATHAALTPVRGRVDGAGGQG